MKLYWCAQTRAARAVWMLEELGKPYERVQIDIRNPEAPRESEFALTSPMGKVPALADGDVRLSESAAICLYLADRYAPGRLAPALDDDRRGPFLYWMFFTPAVIEPAMSEKVSGGKPNRLQNGWGDFDSMIETFEAGLGKGPWLLGDDFTAADVMVGSSAVFLRQFGMLPESPSIHAYADRCLERPAYAKTLAMESEAQSAQ